MIKYFGYVLLLVVVCGCSFKYASQRYVTFEADKVKAAIAGVPIAGDGKITINAVKLLEIK